MEDYEELKALALSLGADLFGVGDLYSLSVQELIRNGEDMSDYTRAVSMAVIFPKEVVNQLEKGPTHTYLKYYDVLNSRLDDIALRISNHLQKKGHKSFPVPASQRVRQTKYYGIFSHRMAGQLAGLGWIGKNSSLINRDYGPRLRLVTVLTNAPVKTDVPIKNRCGTCTLCQEACPAGAIKGVSFEPGDDLERRLDVKACDDYLFSVRHSFGKRVCGRCLAVCPWGK